MSCYPRGLVCAGEDAVECEICLVERRMQRGLVRDFLPLALQLLASALAVAPRVAGRGLRERLAGGTDLLETAEKILGQSFLHKYSTRPAQAGAALGPAATSKPVEPSADMSMVDAERLREAAKLTLQMLGNLVHGCETAQVTYNRYLHIKWRLCFSADHLRLYACCL